MVKSEVIVLAECSTKLGNAGSRIQEDLMLQVEKREKENVSRPTERKEGSDQWAQGKER